MTTKRFCNINVRTCAVRAIIIVTWFFTISGAAILEAQEQATELPAYQQHMLWAANNWDAGGSVDCPQLYTAAGMTNAIVYGGRAVIMETAQAVLFSHAPLSRESAFGLVILTQCHNASARNDLLTAGQDRVLEFLASIQMN